MKIGFTQALSERYLAYALSTIVSRSLPDVRDGLKPVHRRLVYAMYELNLNPHAHFKKCARVVGDVMGKFHPHGDSAIYGALVRLVQDFSVRYPLIEGQGNFGNIDGDSAAAMRYTEARLTPIALELLRGIEESAVAMKPNYDGETEEPLVLPSCFPNILANGATGIAVGMATSSPPHNLEELCLSLIHLIDDPKAPLEITGPDFPTGGIVVDTHDVIQKIYESGKGSFRLRARFSQEILKDGRSHVVITEIPYQVEKSTLIKDIADLVLEKKVQGLEDVRDESSDSLRIVLEIKSQTNPYEVMEKLFRTTDLESKIPVNLNVLSENQVPLVMSLRQMLLAFLKHRFDIQQRIFSTQLNKIRGRLAIVEGHLIIYQHLDDVIHLIRFEDDPKETMKARYHLDDAQVEAILNLRLRTLQKMQEETIKKEHEVLVKNKIELDRLLESPQKQKAFIKKDLKRLITAFGKKTDLGRRRTTFEDLPQIKESKEVIEKEQVYVVCSSKNWIRIVRVITNLKYKEGDSERFIFPAQTTDMFCICTPSGRFFTLPVHRLPKEKGTGSPLREWIHLEEEILSACILSEDTEELMLISQDVKGFRVKTEDIITQTRNGKQICSTGVILKKCLLITGDTLLLVSTTRKMLAISCENIPLLSKGKGVILQKNARLSDAMLIDSAQGFSWKKNGKIYVEKDLRRWIGTRGGVGRLAPLNFPKENMFFLE